MEKAYELWRAFQDRVLGPATALVLLACTLLALVEVVRRYIFGYSFEWQQDAVTLFILSAVFLYFGISQRHGAHLQVGLLIGILEALGPRGHRAMEVIRVGVSIVAFLFMVVVVWWGIPDIKDSIEFASRSESLTFLMWPFLVALLVGFAFMAISFFFQIYRGVQGLRGRKVLEEPSESGSLH